MLLLTKGRAAAAAFAILLQFESAKAQDDSSSALDPAPPGSSSPAGDGGNTTPVDTTTSSSTTSSSTSELPPPDSTTPTASSTTPVDNTSPVTSSSSTSTPPATTLQTTPVVQASSSSSSSSSLVTSSHIIKQSISTDSAGRSAVVIVDDLTTTVPVSEASSIAAAASSSAAALQGGQGSSGGMSAKAIAIPVGIVGGIIALAVIGYIFFRKFKSNRHDDAIKWPEVKASDDDSSLMPLGARRVQGAGIEFPSESSGHGHSPSEVSISMRQHSPSILSTYAPTELQRQPSPGPQAPYGQTYLGDSRSSYYDPYLGANTPSQGYNLNGAAVSRRPSNMSMSSSSAGLPLGSISGATSGSRVSFSEEDRPAWPQNMAAMRAAYLAEGHNGETEEMGDPFRSPSGSYVDVKRSGTITSDVSPTRSLKLGIANPSDEA